MTKLGILGPRHTFHDIARSKFLPNDQYVLYSSFEEIFQALKKGQIKRALVAIRNSTSGMVANNLDRIKKEGFKLIDQYELPVNLCLGSKGMMKLEKIKKIYSHPMAIKETQGYFSKYSHITFVASSSTAGAIDELQQNVKEHAAVISSREAIEENNLQLISENIEDHPDNSTTFSLIEV